jgi:hypothetical protein
MALPTVVIAPTTPMTPPSRNISSKQPSAARRELQLTDTGEHQVQFHRDPGDDHHAVHGTEPSHVEPQRR